MSEIRCEAEVQRGLRIGRNVPLNLFPFRPCGSTVNVRPSIVNGDIHYLCDRCRSWLELQAAAQPSEEPR